MSTMEEATKSEEFSGEVQKFMEFNLGSETFAIPLLTVKEVIAVPTFTTVPFTPNYFLGIMNLRGQVLSVIDLRKKMNIKPREDEAETCVIILDLNPITIGVVVDSINRVLSLASDQISETPEIESKVGKEYITGIHRSDNELTILIDIAKILDSKDIKIINTHANVAA